MRTARRQHLQYWDQSFEEHRHHNTFQFHDWPYTLEVGFTCGCTGQEQEWRLSLKDLKAQLPHARGSYFRAREQFRARQGAIQKKEGRRAQRRARALLHQCLTKQQRWDLRGSKAFTIEGRDGRHYRITEGTASNVILLERGQPVKRLCVVFQNHAPLPMYDLMLAQKLLLESAPEEFWKLANVVEIRPAVPLQPLNLPDQVVDDPREWVARRVAG